jgi:hypothetical protein
MGGTGSKPAEPKFAPDYSGATFSAAEVQRQLGVAQAQAAESVQKATAATTASLGSFYKPILWLLGIGALVVIGIVLYDTFAPSWMPNIFFARNWDATPDAAANQKLYISYAHYGTDNTSKYTDVTQKVTSMIVGETTLPSFTVGWSDLGLPSDPYPNEASTLYIQYFVGSSAYVDVEFATGAKTSQLPLAVQGSQGTLTPISGSGTAPLAAPPPTAASRIYNAIFGDSSGDLAPSYHDATSSAVIKGNQAPLSSDGQGGYGMQWWMFVKDWNYGYGKKKSVVKRPDATNSAVMNPHISLHPTDNSLQIRVSVFPDKEGGSSKSTPAPAGHSGSTDDVFLCDVPNIPLQTWFSVSVTVFGRNMDVYIDGKLVKSCFLSGVPKPAVGDIQLTPEGGFSGRICGFYHYPRMLTPGDAQTFYNAGTSCKGKTESGIGSKATGYSVKFGVYDSLGKNVQEYTF